MSQLLSALPIGSRVKFGKCQVDEETPQNITWTVVAKNHASTPAYPNNSVTLHASEIVDLRCFDAAEPDNAGKPFSKRNGNNQYAVSNMANWLNSRAAAGEWYTPGHDADAPPDAGTHVQYKTQHVSRPGFLHLFSKTEYAAILNTTVRTAKVNSDGGGYEDISAKLFLPSAMEVGLGQENGVSEGAPWEYYTSDASRIAYLTSQCYDNTLSSSKPSNATTAWKWWIRTPKLSNVYHVHNIGADGTLGEEMACNGDGGIRPALNLSAMLEVSDDTDTDGCYTFIWKQPDPPKPQDKIYIYNANGELTEKFDETVTCTLSDKLNGELTLTFSVQYSRLPVIARDSLIKFLGQYYRIVRMQLDVSGGQYLLDVSCEQESISLVDEPLESFDFAGKPIVALERLLNGTGMTADTEFTDTIAVSVQNGNRRSVLLEIAALCGGELEYDGHVIHVVRHRGSETAKSILSICKYYDVRKVEDVQEETESYVVSALSVGGYSVGDEVELSFAPLGISVQKRITGIRYNPFNCIEVQIEIGDYIQDVTNDNAETSRMYLVKTEASIEFEKYINSAEGTAAINSVLSGTYVTSDELGEYVTVAELDVSVKQYLNGAEGQAAIVSAVSGEFLDKDALDGYATTTEVSTSITQEINRFGASLTLSATTSEKPPSGYVTYTHVIYAGVRYGFAESSDGYYASTNAGVDSSYSYAGFNFSNSGSPTRVTLRCISNGESNYDFGIVSTINSYLTQNSAEDSSNVLHSFKGEASSSYEDIVLTVPSGESFITVKYIKDGSTSSGDDCFKIKVLTESGSTMTSTLTLKSDGISLSSADITFTGVVTFESLSTPNATTIDGSNIKTGVISAERVDTSSLRAQEIWYYEQDTGNYYSVMSCELSGDNTTTYVGPKDIDNGYAQFMQLYGTQIYLMRPGYESPGDDTCALMFDIANRTLTPSTTDAWEIGSDAYHFSRVWARRFAFGEANHQGCYLRVTGTELRFYYNDGNNYEVLFEW